MVTDPEKYLLGLTTTDPDILQELAKHPDKFIRARVASNKHSPIKTLRALSTDSDFGVRASVALNEKTPSSLLARMITRALRSDDTSSIVSSALANNPHTPPMFLEHLFVQSTSWGVRIGLAGNPSTPQNILKKLSELPKEKTSNLGWW